MSIFGKKIGPSQGAPQTAHLGRLEPPPQIALRREIFRISCREGYNNELGHHESFLLPPPL